MLDAGINRFFEIKISFCKFAFGCISELKSPQHLLWLIYCLCFGSSTFLLCVAMDGYGCMVIAYITTLPLYQSWNLFPLLLLISLSCDRHFSPPPLFFHHHPLGGSFPGGGGHIERISPDFPLTLFPFTHICFASTSFRPCNGCIIDFKALKPLSVS